MAAVKGISSLGKKRLIRDGQGFRKKINAPILPEIAIEKFFQKV
jgi:hypothetical protein